MKRPSIAVVVVNWNTPQLVLDCLDALRKSEGVSWHLYLVDNASSDDSAARLANLGDDVTFIQSAVNGGWTGGNNLGVERALEDRCELLFMLNSDALVIPDTLRNLQREAEQRPTAIIGPVQLSLCQTEYNFTASSLDPITGMPSLPRAFAVASHDGQSLPERQVSAYVQGSGLLVPAEVFRTLGKFDDRFYLNYDDTDFCARAREAGHEVVIVKTARLLHATSGSIGGASSPLNTYFLTRNSLLFARLHGSRSQRRAQLVHLFRSGLNATWVSGRLSRAATLLFSRDARLRAFRRGIVDYLLNRFGDCPPMIRKLQIEAAAAPH